MTNNVRRFKDSRGVRWEVWDVRPKSLERRFITPATPPEGVERRETPQFRVSLGPDMARGWLIFDNGSQRRRLAPVPAHWEELSDTALAQLCEAAKVVKARSA